MVQGVGATAAWLIGGPLVDGPGWEGIFFINLPLGRPRNAPQERLEAVPAPAQN